MKLVHNKCSHGIFPLECEECGKHPDPLVRFLFSMGIHEIICHDERDYILKVYTDNEDLEVAYFDKEEIYNLHLKIKGSDDYKWIADSDNSSKRFNYFIIQKVEENGFSSLIENANKKLVL